MIFLGPLSDRGNWPVVSQSPITTVNIGLSQWQINTLLKNCECQLKLMCIQVYHVRLWIWSGSHILMLIWNTLFNSFFWFRQFYILLNWDFILNLGMTDYIVFMFSLLLPSVSWSQCFWSRGCTIHHAAHTYGCVRSWLEHTAYGSLQLVYKRHNDTADKCYTRTQR